MLAGAVPRRSFRPFWIAPKGARRRGGEIPPKSNGTVQTRREEASPSPTGAKGYKWGGRVWDPPLRRYKGHKSPTGVGAAFGRPQTARQGCRALQGCIIRHPPHHGGAPVEAHPKQVAQTALWSCRTVATGGRTAMRQRPPRAGIFAPGFRTKLSRKWGSGGRLPLSGGDGRRPEGVG